MKHKINRILCIFLTVLLCVGFLNIEAVYATAASGKCGNNLIWSLAGGVLTISGSGAMDDYRAEENSPPWVDVAEQIQVIKVTEGVTTIGNSAFSNLPNLNAVTLPSTVTRLGVLAFQGCKNLKQIAMPAVTEIGRGCFFGCISIRTVKLPETLRVIEDRAFYMCDSLAGITIPGSVTDLGEMVFSYCVNLVYAKIEAPIQVLPFWTFYGCELLWEVYLPSSVKTVEHNAFGECPELYYVDCKGSAEAKAEIEKQLSQETIKESTGTHASYTYTDNAYVVTTTKENKNEETGTTEHETTINATVTESSGWETVVDSVESAVNSGKVPSVDVEVQGDPAMSEGALNDLADKEVVVNIHTSDNVDWQVIMRDQNADTLKGTQNFAVSLSKNEQGKYTDVIGPAESYTVNLGSTTLNSTILVPLGIGTARKVATLYVVDGNELRKLSSVIVDDDGKAAFHVAGTEAGDYVIALDVQNIPQEEVRIPQKLASEYDITYGATLMDAYGNQYVLTGRVNKMGFGIGTLTLIVVGVLVGSGILVGVVMVIWNKQKMKFERMHRTKKR